MMIVASDTPEAKIALGKKKYMPDRKMAATRSAWMIWMLVRNMLSGIYFFFPNAIIASGVSEATIIICIVFVVSWRFGYQMVLDHHLFDQRIILVGSGKLAQGIINEIENKIDCGYTISNIIVERENQNIYQFQNSNNYQINRCNDIREIIREHKIQKVVVALEEKRGLFPLNELLRCRVSGIDVIEGNTFYEMLTGKLSVNQLNPTWLIFANGFRKPKIKQVSKRFLDIVLASLMLLILSPLMLLVAVLIKMDSKGPAIFSQERIGHHKRPYMIHKFRSMITDAEKHSGPVWAEDDDPRITRFGRYLRKLRIDEIPQLWNVLKGEMSFIGPRPEREYFVKELETIIPYYQLRFTVKPGISGWAQISYGYGASVEDAIEKLNYDLFYTKNMSFLLDMLIVFRTVKIVLFGKGAR
jgi:sugar transferase (PEP-CTERM system associated)